MDVTTSMLVSLRLSMTSMIKVSPCPMPGSSYGHVQRFGKLTLFPAIVGAGNVPPARTTLHEKVGMKNLIPSIVHPRACVTIRTNVRVSNSQLGGGANSSVCSS